MRDLAGITPTPLPLAFALQAGCADMGAPAPAPATLHAPDAEAKALWLAHLARALRARAP